MSAGPTICGGGLLLVLLAWFRYLAGRPRPAQPSSPAQRSDVVAGKIVMTTGVALLVAGLVWTTYEFVS